MAFYDRHEWEAARKQALHDSGYQCQRCGTSLVGLGKACHVHHKKELRRAPALRVEPLNLVSFADPATPASTTRPGARLR